MTHKILSSIAVVVAMSISPSVMAQATINGTTISEQDLPQVQARCDELAQNPAGSVPPMASETGANDHGADQAVAGDADNGGNDDVDAGDLHPADANSSTSTSDSFDVSTLTIDMCRDAGLAK
jgi:hypothetical protein